MRLFLAILSILAVAACSRTPQPATAPAPGAGPASAAVPAAADATLVRHHWQLASASDRTGKRIEVLFARADKPLQLDFDAQGLSISNTCNRMRGSYSVAHGKLDIGELAATMMACADPALTALDAAAGRYFRGPLGMVLDNAGASPQLTLTTGAGDTLTFDGVPTPESRYGSEGEIVFLEVAPQERPCNHPLMPGVQCLVVRELHYGASGVREGEPGPWQVLGQPIEGYSHEAGFRNVLRVKRYRIANPPADASSVACVLDMVIESEAPKH